MNTFGYVNVLCGSYTGNLYLKSKNNDSLDLTLFVWADNIDVKNLVIIMLYGDEFQNVYYTQNLKEMDSFSCEDILLNDAESNIVIKYTSYEKNDLIIYNYFDDESTTINSLNVDNLLGLKFPVLMQSTHPLLLKDIYISFSKHSLEINDLYQSSNFLYGSISLIQDCEIDKGNYIMVIDMNEDDKIEFYHTGENKYESITNIDIDLEDILLFVGVINNEDDSMKKLEIFQVNDNNVDSFETVYKFVTSMHPTTFAIDIDNYKNSDSYFIVYLGADENNKNILQIIELQIAISDIIGEYTLSELEPLSMEFISEPKNKIELKKIVMNTFTNDVWIYGMIDDGLLIVDQELSVSVEGIYNKKLFFIRAYIEDVSNEISYKEYYVGNEYGNTTLCDMSFSNNFFYFCGNYYSHINIPFSDEIASSTFLGGFNTDPSQTEQKISSSSPSLSSPSSSDYSIAIGQHTPSSSTTNDQSTEDDNSFSMLNTSYSSTTQGAGSISLKISTETSYDTMDNSSNDSTEMEISLSNSNSSFEETDSTVAFISVFALIILLTLIILGIGYYLFKKNSDKNTKTVDLNRFTRLEQKV